MVRRLSFDSNREIKAPLKNIELPPLIEPISVELPEKTLQSMHRRSSFDWKAQSELEEVIDTCSKHEVTSFTHKIMDELVEKVFDCAVLQTDAQEQS